MDARPSGRPHACLSHAGPIAGSRLPVGTGGGGGGDITEASPTAGPQRESRPGPRDAISVPPLATRSGPVRSCPLRSPPPQRASENVVRKSGRGRLGGTAVKHLPSAQGVILA